MNKKGFTLASALVVALSLVLASCVPAEAIAQKALADVATALPSVPVEAIAQTAVSDVATGLPATPASEIAKTVEAAIATGLPATPAAAIAQTVEAAVNTALPNAPAAGTPQPKAAIGQNIPVFSGLQPLAANDPKASFWLNTADQVAKKTGFQFVGKAYVTDAKVQDITAFYNDALKDWKATPPTTTAFPVVGNATLWVYTLTSQQETLTIAYSAYDAAGTKFLVITELLWK